MKRMYRVATAPDSFDMVEMTISDEKVTTETVLSNVSQVSSWAMKFWYNEGQQLLEQERGA